MCGICGQLSLDPSGKISSHSIQEMMEAIRHRGPDDEGAHVDGRVGLGFRRLSIIDLVSGHQPMSNEDGTVWIVFNGEIYNHEELRTLLEAKGHRYRTKSDTETILHLYEEEGIDGFSRLNGMFGFALWDSRKQTLLLVRDRAGKKPLYYGVENGTLYFGSEIKALQRGGLRDRTMDLEAFSDFLTFLFVPGPKTMFKSVRKVQPGHVLVVSGGKIEERQYWNLHVPGADGYLDYSTPRCVEEFSALLEDAVRLRMISDVPLGAFLSGGLDSGSIVALMRKYSSGPVKTFSVGYRAVTRDNAFYDEREVARETARFLGAEHYDVEVGPEDMALLPRIVSHLEEPMADISVLPQYKLSALTREHVTVSLSGDGSDEMLLGYGKHQSELLRGTYMAIPEALRHSLVEPLVRVLPNFHWRVERIKAAVRYASLPFDERAMGMFAIFDPAMKAEILGANLQHPLSGYDSVSVFRRHLAGQPEGDGANLISYLDFKTRLVDQLLLKLDKVSMAVSLESRAPFLDYRLLEFLVRVPPSQRLHLLRRKYLLKKAAEAWLPASVIRRRKKGFGFPTVAWLRDGATTYFHDILLDERTRRRGYVNMEAVERHLSRVGKGEVQTAWALTILLFFELWCRIFLDEERPV